MSKKLILSLALSGLVLTSTAQTTVAPAIPRDEKIEQQIETLLKKMTLDEKVGQMCELTIDLLQKRANPFAGLNPKDITVDDLKKIVKRYKLEKEFKLGKEMPSQEVMMQLYMRIQGIENAKGFQLDEAMLDSVIGKYKVGSILNVPNGVAQSHQTHSGEIHGGDGYSLCVRCRPDTRNYLYAGWYFLPARRQYGSYLQP